MAVLIFVLWMDQQVKWKSNVKVSWLHIAQRLTQHNRKGEMFSKHLKQVLRNRETLFHANRKEKSFRFQQKKTCCIQNTKTISCNRKWQHIL